MKLIGMELSRQSAEAQVTFGDGTRTIVYACAEMSPKARHLWFELEKAVKHTIATELEIEEPLYKEHPGIQYSEGINVSVWSEPDATENYDILKDAVDRALSGEDFTDRDLGLDRDNS